MRLMLAALLAPTLAFGAVATETPPMLRADIDVGYAGGIDYVQLQDRVDSAFVYSNTGSYLRQLHGVDLSARFSVYHGIAVTLGMPITIWDRNGWQRPRQFRWDPDHSKPTLVGGRELSGTDIEGLSAGRIHAGPRELSLGFRIVPFAQEGLPNRQAPASLAIDFAALFPTGGRHDVVRDDGSAGPGEGGMGVLLGMTAARRMGFVEPWLSGHWHVWAPYRVVLTGADGNPLAGDADDGRYRLDPADEVRMRAGVQMIAQENRAADTAITIDVSLGVTYRGPDEVSSGTRLPVPLDATYGHPAVTGEHVMVDGALQMRFRPKAPVELVADLGGGWIAPHTLEQVSPDAYTVQSGAGSFRARFGLGVRVRIR
jgi:hypothetical protein